jgi:porin
MHLSKQYRALPAIRAALWVIILSAPLMAHRAIADTATSPFGFAATNISDVLANARGGLHSGVRVLDKLDLTASYTGADGALSGWSGFFDLQWTDATDFSGTLVGDLQGVSNIDAPSGVRVANAWIGRDFDGVGGVKAGIIDLNADFDVQATGALFLNSSHGIGPDFARSGANGPSIFPTTGLGIAGWWLPGGHWQIKAGLFEGTPGDPAHPGRESIALTGREGALLVVDVRNHITPNFVLGAGAWTYTAAFPTFGGASAHGNAGFYLIADGKLTGEDGKGLGAWLRVGFANAQINAIEAYAGGGFVYTGVFGDADQAGFAFAAAHLGTPARRAALLAGQPLGGGETTLEATYSVLVTGNLTVQPDIQYVLSPGADPALDDALVVGSRLTLTSN